MRPLLHIRGGARWRAGKWDHDEMQAHELERRAKVLRQEEVMRRYAEEYGRRVEQKGNELVDQILDAAGLRIGVRQRHLRGVSRCRRAERASSGDDNRLGLEQPEQER